MPKFRKLTAEDLAKPNVRKSPEREALLKEYQGYLTKAEQSAGGELTLEEGEKKVTIKNRLKRAGESVGKEVVFLRSGGDSVRFKVGTDEDGE